MSARPTRRQREIEDAVSRERGRLRKTAEVAAGYAERITAERDDLAAQVERLRGLLLEMRPGLEARYARLGYGSDLRTVEAIDAALRDGEQTQAALDGALKDAPNIADYDKPERCPACNSDDPKVRGTLYGTAFGGPDDGEVHYDCVDRWHDKPEED